MMMMMTRMMMMMEINQNSIRESGKISLFGCLFNLGVILIIFVPITVIGGISVLVNPELSHQTEERNVKNHQP